MDEKILKWLYDIHDAIIEIEGFFNDLPLDFNQYKTNTILKRAVERDLKIMVRLLTGYLNKILVSQL